MVNEEILRLYEEKLSLREIGELVGIHPQALRKALISEGLAIKMRDRDESLNAKADEEYIIQKFGGCE